MLPFVWELFLQTVWKKKKHYDGYRMENITFYLVIDAYLAY